MLPHLLFHVSLTMSIWNKLGIQHYSLCTGEETTSELAHGTKIISGRSGTPFTIVTLGLPLPPYYSQLHSAVMGVNQQFEAISPTPPLPTLRANLAALSSAEGVDYSTVWRPQLRDSDETGNVRDTKSKLEESADQNRLTDDLLSIG